MDKAPDAYRTISEVGEDLDIAQHVLRFWETRFPQIKPLKRGGGRRYYRPDDVELLKGIRHLLYREGYTIKGVQRILKEQGAKAVQAVGRAGSLVPGLGPASPEDAFDDFVPRRHRNRSILHPRRLRRHRPLRFMQRPRCRSRRPHRNLFLPPAPCSTRRLRPHHAWRMRRSPSPVGVWARDPSSLRWMSGRSRSRRCRRLLPTIRGKRPVGRPCWKRWVSSNPRVPPSGACWHRVIASAAMISQLSDGWMASPSRG